MKNTSLSVFTRQYQITKTLRFELKPYKETAEHLEEFKNKYLKNIVSEDTIRAEKYKKIKKIIDDYHRFFIHTSLSREEKHPPTTDIEDAFCIYRKLTQSTNKKNSDLKKQWKTTQDKLRKTIQKTFIEYKLLKKKLLQEVLPNWIEHQKEEWFEDKDYTKLEAQELLKSFSNWTTYFKGFHINRENMYSNKAQCTAIPNRIITDNAPLFFDAIILFEKIKTLTPPIDFTTVETNMNVKLDTVFCCDYFSAILTQEGIDKYNEIIGGKTEKNGKKLQGINEIINLYNQKNQKHKISRIHTLKKQILGNKNTASFIPEGFLDDTTMLTEIKKFRDYMLEELGTDKNKTTCIHSIVDFFSQFMSYDLKGIYLNTDTSLGHISKSLYQKWDTIEELTRSHRKIKKSTKPESNFLSLEHIRESLEHENEKGNTQEHEDNNQEKNLLDPQKILDYFVNMQHTTHKSPKTGHSVLQQLDKIDKIIRPILALEKLDSDRNAPKNEGDKGGKGFEQTQAIKEFLDFFMSIVHFMKVFYLEKDKKKVLIADKNTKFYNNFDFLYTQLSEAIIPLYNKVRNYITKKPYTLNKIKINFENTTLLDGWDKSKEKANLGVLLLKNEQYYLGIMKKTHNKIFSSTPKPHPAEESFQKMEYKLIAGAIKSLPKKFFAPIYQDIYQASEEIQHIRNHSSHTKGGDPRSGYDKKEFCLSDCHKIIDFYKSCIQKTKDYEVFSFSFPDTATYEDITQFCDEVDNQSYKISFQNIPASYIEEKIASGELVLFRIYNKDFSTSKKKQGTDNLHTIYWKALFEKKNLTECIFKLNGQAEIFYRPSSIKKEITHAKNMPIKNKNPHTTKTHSTFSYDLIKDCRFTQDKFFFHVPVTLNFSAKKPNKNFNTSTLDFLKHNKDIAIIGIDRGERNLLYYSIIDQHGKILAQESLNCVGTCDYYSLLEKKEQERKNARASWSTIKNIKELKEGYLSVVIHTLAELAIKYNAIICLEDLNFGFKRGRFKIEKQIYQKFEKALIDKFSYLVLKNNTEKEAGHYRNAYQLTAPFESFEKMKKQTGILFYVPSFYTSKICPLTGFVNTLYPKYENQEKSITFFEKFDSIKYNSEKQYFEFAFDCHKFTSSKTKSSKTKDSKTKEHMLQNKWTVCTHGEKRWVYNTKDKKTEAINLTEKLIQLFIDNSIEYKNGDIKPQIIQQKNAAFFKSLIYYLKVLLQMRYSNSAENDDFILSPVANKQGIFFNSSTATQAEPQDADANGAFHIALKGLWNLHQINKWNPEQDKHPQLAISNVEWYNFAQQKLYQK